MNLRIKILSAAAIALSAVGLLPAFEQDGGNGNGPTIGITPGVIEMGAFYNGAQMKIEGTTDAGSDVVIAIRGADAVEEFNKKGRAGPIWVTAGKVRISGVPSLLLLFSSKDVRAFVAADAIEKHQLDREAVRNQMRIEPESPDHEIIRTNYLTLKEQQGIHQVWNDAIKIGPQEGERVPYSLEFVWPKKAPPASYSVTAYKIRDGNVEGSTSTILEVVEVGFPARMAYLAKERVYIYGAMSVIVALLAGFGIDFLASKLGKKGISAH